MLARIGPLRRAAWAGAFAYAMLVAAAGCGKPVEIAWSDGKLTTDLGDDRAPLQDKVRATLRKHCGTPDSPKLLGGSPAESARLPLGQRVFQKRCAACHGDAGDGAGPYAQYLDPRPRDYRMGVFKFTSTYTGSRPLRSDLVRTLERGIRGTSMPSFVHLPREELEAVVDYVVALSRRGELEMLLAQAADAEDDLAEDQAAEMVQIVLGYWREAPANQVLFASVEPPYTLESLELGHKAFADSSIGCVRCHGADGRGKTTENAKGFDDHWGFKTRAADLTSSMLRGGAEAQDIYRRIVGGISGTPMPSFKANLKTDPDVAWHLVHYVQHVSNVRRRASVGLPAETLPPFEPSPAPSTEPTGPSAEPTGPSAEPTGPSAESNVSPSSTESGE